MRKRSASLRVRLAIGGSALLVGVLGLEGILRLARYDPLGRVLGGRDLFLQESPDPILGYELTPRAQGFAWGCNVRINSLGMRDREYSLKKPAGTKRILVLGDSITFGNFLPLDATYPKRLEASCRLAGRRVEVLNLGVGGYDTLQEVAFLERRGLVCEPDLVVVGYCMNDTDMRSVNLVVVQTVQRYGWLIRHSRLLQMLTVDLERATEFELSDSGDGDDEFVRRYKPYIAPLQDDATVKALMAHIREYANGAGGGIGQSPFLEWHVSPARVGRIRHAFERLRRLSDQHGFRVAVTVFPCLNEDPHEQAYRWAYALIEHEAARLGFQYVNVEVPLRAEGLFRFHVRPTDRLHLNAAGHEVVARVLHAALCGGPGREKGASPSRGAAARP